MSHGPLAGIVWWGECSRVVRERWWRFSAEGETGCRKNEQRRTEKWRGDCPHWSSTPRERSKWRLRMMRRLKIYLKLHLASLSFRLLSNGSVTSR